MQSSDLDGMTLFLASDGSSAVTGGVFSIDDGQSL
jgi:enoyl-[acyl-carrier-protein] reductase (NADH)